MAFERLQFVIHQGQKVLVLDLTNGKKADIVDVIAKATPIVRSAELGSLLTLTDVTHVAVQDVGKTALIEFVAGNKPYVKAAAVTGVSDLAKAILATTRLLTGRAIMAFDSRKEALDWLVSLPTKP
jgi:hypothetical protein